MSIDLSQYKVGVIRSLEDCGNCKKGGKALRSCTIQIGNEDEDVITVVTSAPNVRDQSRVVVAPIGSSVLGTDGEMMVVTKATVGGVISEGMLCDSRMLGWIGGAQGIAVNLPDNFDIGAVPPSSKPRPNNGESQSGGAESSPVEPGLFEKKLSKEEKKKLAAERKAKRKAAKEAKDS
mmetsp:Transcript_20716/g.31484  ORF Transcript_20716/g.31484 Transcript_20716/m.31484 type:complete len:178 (-) Transcript_20716:702-1235(-)|eukprot:CAMPEP_0194128778 /NCGR_PEP_ID=MMETSP0150-20130528/61235_1 /TAXON_ID=122233 /ORGANISM="Chaetoceros debilis, Strain MM31A-1" /LENGTH=177 /DNA_ID=CAMNT_0038822789 /DNA_START=141 /DNA_END=674 /DNA_ORIENTATION=-